MAMASAIAALGAGSVWTDRGMCQRLIEWRSIVTVHIGPGLGLLIRATGLSGRKRSAARTMVAHTARTVPLAATRAPVARPVRVRACVGRGGTATPLESGPARPVGRPVGPSSPHRLGLRGVTVGLGGLLIEQAPSFAIEDAPNLRERCRCQLGRAHRPHRPSRWSSRKRAA
jgi:hypothetical protein